MKSAKKSVQQILAPLPHSGEGAVIEGFVEVASPLLLVETHPGEISPKVLLRQSDVGNPGEVLKRAKTGLWCRLEVNPGAEIRLAHQAHASFLPSQTDLSIRLINDWSYSRIDSFFGTSGCSQAGCYFNNYTGNKCALNLSDAILRSGYTMPTATNVQYCDSPAHANPRVRNADGMARIVRAKNGGRIDISGYQNRPSWRGIVYFEGGIGNATGHIDLWTGTRGKHANYPDAEVVWFWQLAE